MLVRKERRDCVTLAGLLALDTYPQHFYPRLTVTFACFPGRDKTPQGSVKFLDSESMVGPIPAVPLDTVAVVRRNMRVGGVLEGGLRYDVPDYPLDAVREAVCNALMHRDYFPMERGVQIQVNMYEDRLEVLSPGGLYGAVTVDMLGEVGASLARNPSLSALLETTPYEGGGYVAENRGTGLVLIQSELGANGMPKAEVTDRPSLFKIVMRRRGAEEPENDCSKSDLRADAAVAGNSKAPQVEDTVISTLDELGTARTSEIAERSGLGRSTVAKALRKLLQRGLVSVTPGAVNSPTRRYTLTL